MSQQNKNTQNESVEQQKKRQHDIDIEPQREGAKTKEKKDSNS